MNSSSGLGRPGPGQPDFDGPSDGPWQANVPPPQFGSPGHPQQPAAPSPGPWGPPSLAPSGPPPGGPAQRRRGARGMVLGGSLVVAVALGLLAWQLLPATPSASPTPNAEPPQATPTAAATAEPTVLRTPETPRPTSSAAVTGGGIGSPVRYRSGDGEAQVTVTRATWTDNGLLEPGPGMSYLVLDVTFEGISGDVATGPFFTAVREPAGARRMLTVGAQLDRQLAMRTLGQGQDNTGQIAFEVARGPVAFEVLSELLEPVASVDVPG
ncbi:MAG: hypothetical protein QM582_00635 [Micropruina sp.]|uniref:hypothetical protein n=1 Tax=Micropruina sp. TaxID=2737536 RepID=UPI0039E4A870